MAAGGRQLPASPPHTPPYPGACVGREGGAQGLLICTPFFQFEILLQGLWGDEVQLIDPNWGAFTLKPIAGRRERGGHKGLRSTLTCPRRPGARLRRRRGLGSWGGGGRHSGTVADRGCRAQTTFGFRKPSQTEVGEGVRIGTHGREVQGGVPSRLPMTSADCFSPSLVLPPLPGSLLSLPPGSSPPCPTSSHVATR